MKNLPVMTTGLKARFFTQPTEEPPPTPSVGDIVLIRNCKVSTTIMGFVLTHPLTLYTGHSRPRFTPDS